ncbi:MAG: lysophospholipid acyltransferase family protein [Burkholderiaceae bacterium]|nr:lysophospholipid acyltransferase family protein [Burkholderiaceae bacterium]
MTLLMRLLAHVPLSTMHRIGASLGWLAWVGSSGYRSRFKANAESAGLTPAQYRPAISSVGRALAELPWIWMRAPGVKVLPRIVHWEGVPEVEAALALGKGAIFITPHLGSWEMLGQAIAERFSPQYGPMTALFRPSRQPWLADLVAASRDRPCLKMLPTNTSGVRGLIRTLRAGGYTGILPDQVPPQGQGVWAPFFGRPAYTMTLPARLAQQTGAAVFLSVCERLAPGKGYAIRFEQVTGSPLNDPKAPVEAAATAMNEGIERLIRRLPGQYIWDYARYKQPRHEDGYAQSAPKGGVKENSKEGQP